MNTDNPEVVFKFLTPDRVDVLENGFLRFTQPIHLNDDFDLAPVYQNFLSDQARPKEVRAAVEQTANSRAIDAAVKKYREGQTRAFKRKHSQSELRKFLVRQAGGETALLTSFKNSGQEILLQALTDIDSELRDMFALRLREGLGVLSLSEDGTNEAMWAYYASDRRGFAIEFDAAHEFFASQEDDPEEVTGLRKVQYNKQRPQFTSIADPNNSMQKLLLVKGPNWSGEREWRVIRTLATSDKQIGDVHLFRLPSEAIKTVIIGSACSPDVIRRIEAALDSANLRHVLRKRAEPSVVDFGLEFKEGFSR